MKRRTSDNKFILIKINTLLFGVSAALLSYNWYLMFAKGYVGSITSIIQLDNGRFILPLLIAILLAGFFYSLTVLRPDAARLHREKRLMELEMRAAKKRAFFDRVTGLHNYLFFEQSMKTCLKNSAKSKTHLGIILFDFESLEEPNAEQGLSWMDSYLADVGKCLVKSARENDVVARVGNARLAILLPQIQIHDLRSIYKRFGNTIAKSVTPSGIASDEFIFSIGYSFDFEDVNTPDALFTAAVNSLVVRKRLAKD